MQEEHMGFWDKVADKWVSPAGFLILFGAVTWGIQLNIAVLEQAKYSAQMQATVNGNSQAIKEDAQMMIRIGVLLDNLEKRVSENETHVHEHEKDSQKWKYKINQNSQLIETLREQRTR